MNEEQFETLTRRIEESNRKVIEEANSKQTKVIRDYIQQEISEVKEDFEKAITQSENKLQAKYEELNKKHTQLQKQLKKNNIVIWGVQPPKENLPEFIINKLKTLLQINITVSEIDNAFTFGQEENRKHILVKSTSFLKKKEILANGKKLKGTGISISEDLTKEEREESKILRKHLKEAKEKSLNAFIRNNQLIVNGQTFTVSELLDSDENEIEKEQEEEEVDNRITNSSASATPTIRTVPFFSEEVENTEDVDEVFTKERVIKKSTKDKEKKQDKEKKEPRTSARSAALCNLSLARNNRV
ncbi:unnamed protein product [Ceutorhynchus assimilis]|uniref:Uncharacterized protein n=1 Tax=Ceutorhynchus assimilis TaxID=467358 RepID=A0A9N9MCX0_9CUCU|nr:unnamed protein product [Ceutorhynchus assimilis]